MANSTPNQPTPLLNMKKLKKGILEEALALERALSSKQAGSKPTPISDGFLTGSSLLIGGN